MSYGDVIIKKLSKIMDTFNLLWLQLQVNWVKCAIHREVNLIWNNLEHRIAD